MLRDELLNRASINFTSSTSSTPAAATLGELLQQRAQGQAGDRAFTFCHDDETQTTRTYGELDRRARALAAVLEAHAAPGDRALLVYPAGLEFLEAFLGCVYAGLLPVPATYPKPRRPLPRLSAIARDCGAKLALTTTQTLTTLDLARTAPELASLAWIASDAPPAHVDLAWRPKLVTNDALAFLQYTSGSTSDPKGVMISHGNLLHNLELIRRGFDLPRAGDAARPVGVFWLPAYHDMGLIGGLLETLYLGGESVLLSPGAFLQRPLRWLETIAAARATISGAPNFAYDLCVRRTTPEQRAALDLSHWRLAFCGAEPVRAETLARFATAFAPSGFQNTAFYPCYGLAEATLLAAGELGPAAPIIKTLDRAALAEHRVVEVAPSVARDAPRGAQAFVGCGRPLLDQRLIIVDPRARRPCAGDRVGEIWLQGPSVAQGYWNRPEETRRTFAAHLRGEPSSTFLRTGDLGFVSDGQLFITGRLKEVLVMRGRNLYPHDLELTAQAAHPALAHGATAAFALKRDGEERLVLVHELDRQQRGFDLDEIMRQVRRAVAAEHDVEVAGVALLRPASLPRTTSGKIQRRLCRRRYQEGKLKTLASWSALAPVPRLSGASSNGTSPPQEPPASAAQIETWLLAWLAERAALTESELAADRPFTDCGLDSLAAVELSQQLEAWLGAPLSPTLAWSHPTPARLAHHLASTLAGAASSPPAPPTGESFESLLSEIESLNESQAEAILKRLSP